MFLKLDQIYAGQLSDDGPSTETQLFKSHAVAVSESQGSDKN